MALKTENVRYRVVDFSGLNSARIRACSVLASVL
jgi:hypothetical protein